MSARRARGERAVAHASLRQMTMKPSEVLVRLNDHHRNTVFPCVFEEGITFDMVCEVEYNFKLLGKRLNVTHTDVWFAADRKEESHVKVHNRLCTQRVL